MKIIKLTKGKLAFVDDEDYENLSKYSWCTQYSEKSRCWYAKRGTYINRINKTFLMHREIMKTPRGFSVDHINHNGLDNRKSNLRNCTYQENQCNRKGADINSASKYIGVTWNKNAKKWYAEVMLNRKKHYIGVFVNEKMAAIARDKLALKLHGEFASLNFPGAFQ